MTKLGFKFYTNQWYHYYISIYILTRVKGSLRPLKKIRFRQKSPTKTDSDTLTETIMFFLHFLDYRMEKFKIGLTNNFDANVNTSKLGIYDLCGQWPGKVLNFGEPMRVDCIDGSKLSRFVIVQQSPEIEQKYRDRRLAFAEIEVYAETRLDDVALKKPAHLSSMGGNYAIYNASYGVDNNFNAAWRFPHAAINYEYSNWFVVDLLAAYKVKYVVDRSVEQFVAGVQYKCTSEMQCLHTDICTAIYAIGVFGTNVWSKGAL
ncbi:hypothetical protein HELRODRAFT_178978 [Helobdella robusta]|uniref:Uncharacterized protein n=1 Tax=Helobdella robusta TaxID=6412 RepID=T1FE00_HELRO|nr:hypothetical protein HELRODRAFT_178978 [Helobdella robusta]ESN95795.1 hypothetical protein HELRODRAFT_178978 [Helobdella robusta]